VNTVVIYCPGKSVGFFGGGEGINEADLTLQFTGGAFVNRIKGQIYFCDMGFLSIPNSHFMTLPDRGLVIGTAVDKPWFLDGGLH
jgi:hypothetical protein